MDPISLAVILQLIPVFFLSFLWGSKVQLQIVWLVQSEKSVCIAVLHLIDA